MNTTRNRAHGFSLIELVIVVVIIGIIAAIAIPRMSRGTASAQDSMLTANLRILRSAVDLFASEHGNNYPPLATIVDQLTLYSDASGATVTAKDATHVFGPYLREVPALPVGATRKGCSGIAAADAAGVGWLYDETSGIITPNTGAEQDATGKAYSSY